MCVCLHFTDYKIEVEEGLAVCLKSELESVRAKNLTQVVWLQSPCALK